MLPCSAIHRGFTLIELLVTVALIAILAAIATPSLKSLIVNNKIQAATTEIHSVLAGARAESVKRGGDARVTVVANTLSGSTPNWSSGITVFYDTTANANGNTPPTDATKLIMKTDALPTDISINVNFNHIIFNGLGRTITSTGAPTGGAIAVGTAGYDWRCVIVSLTGRVRTKKITDAAYNADGCTTS